MKKALIVGLNVTSFTIIDSQIGILNSLAIFFIAGAIPGTDYSIPPLGMLLVTMSLVSLAAYGLNITYKRTSPSFAEPTLPKKRYGRI